MTIMGEYGLKCKKCNTVWHTRPSFDRGVAFCPTCKSGSPIRGRNNDTSKLPVVEQPEIQNQTDAQRRFQDIIV